MKLVNMHTDTVIAIVGVLIETYLTARERKIDTDSFKILRVAINSAFQAIDEQEQLSRPGAEPACDDYVVCLEDGKKFKTLKRHLQAAHNLSPSEYRRRWSLPHDYPIIAKNYSKQRSAIAQVSGLGKRD